jgi:conjugal transfer pilus assembly protein TraB
VLHNLLTDADPRALGLEGLAQELRRLAARTEQLAGWLERLAAGQTARLAPREAPPATRASPELQSGVETLRAEVEHLRGELERARREPPPAPEAAPKSTPQPPAEPPPTSGPPDLERLFASPPTLRPALPSPVGPGAAGGPGGTGSPSPIRVIDADTGRPKGDTGDTGSGTDTRAETLFVPAGSLLKGVLLTGLDAPTGRSARRDPYPALVRVKHEAILPNRFRADVRECFLVAAGFGDLSAERAYLRGETLSCVRADGGVIEVRIDGYAVGEDGKLGVRGRLVSKQGQVLAGALAAGFLQGFGAAFQQLPVPVLASPGERVPYQQAFSPEALQGAALSGAGRAMERLAEFYLDMAEEMFPVIEVDAGRPVELVLNRGAALKLAHGRP